MSNLQVYIDGRLADPSTEYAIVDDDGVDVVRFTKSQAGKRVVLMREHRYVGGTRMRA